jgi:hypothetical protein
MTTWRGFDLITLFPTGDMKSTLFGQVIYFSFANDIYKKRALRVDSRLLNFSQSGNFA